VLNYLHNRASSEKTELQQNHHCCFANITTH
jgi:hypothetical protein